MRFLRFLSSTERSPALPVDTPPDRHRPSKYENLNSTGTLFRLGWLSGSHRAARVAPQDDVNVPPHPVMMASHRRIIVPSKTLQLQQLGYENRHCPCGCRPARGGKATPVGLSLIGVGLWEPARRHPGTKLRSRRTRRC